MKRSLLRLALPILCSLTIWPLPAQEGDPFQLPRDEQIQDLLQAITAYEESAESNSDFVDPTYLIEALKRVEAQFSSDSSTSEVQRLALPVIYFRIDHNARAVELLEDYLQGNPGSSRGRLLLALGYLRQEKYLQARTLARNSVESEPGNAYARYLLGLSEIGLNQIDEAVVHLKDAVSLHPGFADALFELGVLYGKNAETLVQAHDALAKALALGLERPDVYFNLGFVLTKLGKHEDAVPKLKRAIELSPDHAQAHYSLSESLRKLGRQEESRAAQERFGALKAADRENIRREAQGLNYFEQGMKALRANDRLDEAHQWFRKTLEIFPAMGAAHYRLAQIDLLRKRAADALGSIHRAIEINPLEAEYYFILSRCLQETNAPGAMDAIRQAITLNPKTADFHNVLGNLSFGRGDYQTAVEAYSKAAEIQPENPAFHLNLSVALGKTGDSRGSQEEKDLYFKLIRAKKP